ncbi:hypothetical protein CCO03_05620 [Comamonas serinivorans]|uniref:Uncharacterized protein n=1 Tax=Comamonas serinivorans TaxID=1082851 RepID=A0A1Y0EKQ8_9BURK|nr:SRPBCC family protein [Comamonas serinivorans]ARU04225.1 hypothetical protein CCO03_05620 [Comamonas serinivorans]
MTIPTRPHDATPSTPTVPVVTSPALAADAAAPPSPRGDAALAPDWPFAAWWPPLIGALIGLALRLAFFGEPGDAFSAMLAACIYGAPIVCGAATVYLAERQRRRSWLFYVFAPMGATALMVLGSMAILIEGLVCAVFIVPLFALLGAVAGLVMGVICRLTHWPRHALGCVIALPLLLGGVEHRLPLPDTYAQAEQSVWIAAPPARIWHDIFHIQDIGPDEGGTALAWLAGVPRPLGVVTTGTDQPVREVQWHQGIRFKEYITDLRENEHVHWRFDFQPGDIPQGALDDHVTIGGDYFDMLDAGYRLTPEAGGTRLTLSIRWRVSTRFNWYATPLSRLLTNDFAQHVLAIYKARAEADPASAPAGSPASVPATGTNTLAAAVSPARP